MGPYTEPLEGTRHHKGRVWANTIEANTIDTQNYINQMPIFCMWN